MRRVFLIPVVLALTACGGEQGASSGAEWTTYRNADLGFSVRYPADWHRAEARLTPNLGDPTEILSLGTYPLRVGGDRCSHMPVRALEDFRPVDAFVSIQERADPAPGELVPRRSFKAPDDRSSGRFCVPDRDRLDEWLVFGDSGRGFYAIVALGDEASPETRAQLVQVLNSLEVERR